MKNIFVVDDDDLLLDLLQLRLSLAGYRVFTACDGAAALQMLDAFRPDLIILDQMMPTLSGNEVITRLRQTEKHADTPIILLSLRSGREDIASARAVGSTDYFAKPFDPDILLTRIADLLSDRVKPTSWASKGLSLFGAAIALAATPVAAQTEREPLALAIAAHDSGNHDEAASLMRRAAETEPDNADLWLRLGLELSHQGDFEASILALSKAVMLAPDYADARSSLERVQNWAALEREKPRNLAVVVPNGPVDTRGFQEPRSIPANVGQWSFTAVHSESWLSNPNAPKWKDSIFAVGFSPKKGTGYLLQGESSKRLGKHDVLISGQGEWRISARASAYVGASIGLHPNSRENWSARAGLAAGLGKGFEGRIDGRAAKYASGTVAALTPHLSYTAPSDKATVIAGWINLWDETGVRRSGWSLRADIRPIDRLSFYLGAADYPDTENGITRRTRARFAGLSYSLKPNLRMTLGFEKEARLASATRRSLSAGLRWSIGKRSP